MTEEKKKKTLDFEKQFKEMKLKITNKHDRFIQNCNN